jgi:putative exporter of polyketide antibiotics
MVLSAPLSRGRWTIAGGVGAVLAVAVMTAVFALGICVGALVAGSDVVTPTAGALVLGLYGAAMVGVGVAVGGLWRTSWAAEIVAAVVVATFLVNLLAPALKLPGWVGQVALTAHLGQPMIGTWDWGGMLACAVIAVGGILLGAWGMGRRDVVR